MKGLYYWPSFNRYGTVFEEGNMGGYRYRVVSCGTHPCAYIEIPRNHPLYNVGYGDCDIDCHGGLTYSGLQPGGDIMKTAPDSWWIGWDYAHCEDAMLCANIWTSGKIWTVEEIREHCKYVIAQLEKMEPGI